MGINANRTGWVVVRDGKIASAHRTEHAATHAAELDGLVLAIEATSPTMAIGDRVRSFGGQVIPASCSGKRAKR